MTHGSNTNALNPELTNETVERMYHDWDAALARLEELPPERLDEGVDGLLSLYAKDAIIETPLIPRSKVLARCTEPDTRLVFALLGWRAISPFGGWARAPRISGRPELSNSLTDVPQDGVKDLRYVLCPHPAGKCFGTSFSLVILSRLLWCG